LVAIPDRDGPAFRVEAGEQRMLNAVQVLALVDEEDGARRERDAEEVGHPEHVVEVDDANAIQ
jgi:hypothetical protein